MPHRHCKTCRAPLHADDGHAECVSCLGNCSHCESFSLSSLRSQIAFFSESDSAPRALPFSSSQGPARKKQRGRGFERLETNKLTSAQCPRASPSPQREDSPVLFTQPDQRPSAAASDMISFGGSDDEMDDSLSLAASDAEELSGSVTDPALLPLSSSRSARPRTDEQLVRVMTKAVNELGLEWSPPEEPSRSRLDEWFLPGRQQAPCQRSSPFFPKVHDELTKSWRTPYSSRIRPSASSALTSVDGAEEKGYEPPLDKSVAAHLCPPSAIGWKARASHPSKPCRATSALTGRAYSAAGQAASVLHSMAVLQVFQAKMLTSEEAGLDAVSLRDLRSATDLALRATKATAQTIGWSMSSLVVLESHLWLKFPSSMLLSRRTACSGQLWRASRSGLQRLRSRLKRCDTSSRNAPVLLLLVAPSLRRLSSLPSQHLPLPNPNLLRIGRIEGVPARQDATPSRSAKDPGPRSPWIRRLRSPPEHPGRKRRGSSLATAGPPRKQPLTCLLSPRSALGTALSVLLVPHGPTLAPVHPTALIAEKIMHKHYQKESKYTLLPTISVLPLCSQSLASIQPLATRAEAWQAIPGVSKWIMATMRWGYSLQFAQRP